MKETLILQTNDHTALVQTLRGYLKPKTFIALSGAMGAGKTTLVAELLSDQGAEVASPTFALHHSYQAYGLTIVHVDLYRIETEDELESSGFWDLFGNSQSVILTEWIERISLKEIPLDWCVLEVKIQVQPDGHRLYTLLSFT